MLLLRACVPGFTFMSKTVAMGGPNGQTFDDLVQGTVAQGTQIIVDGFGTPTKGEVPPRREAQAGMAANSSPTAPRAAP